MIRKHAGPGGKPAYFEAADGTRGRIGLAVATKARELSATETLPAGRKVLVIQVYVGGNWETWDFRERPTVSPAPEVDFQNL